VFTARYGLELYIRFTLIFVFKAVPWLRLLVAGFSPRSPGFDSRSVHVRFVVDKVALRQGFLLVLRCFPFSIIPPMLHTHFYLHVALTRRTNG
jgi:hypothetical protein